MGAHHARPDEQHPFLTQADHIILWHAEPSRLLDLFTHTFGLPLACAIDHYVDEDFELTSGGVALGNLVVEVGIIPEVRERVADGPYFGGLAFQPSSDILQVEVALNERGIRTRGPFRVAVTPAADETVGWPFTGFSNVIAESVSAYPWVFVCAYHGRWYELYPRFADEVQRRGGGPLGVLGAAEVVFGVPDRDDAMVRWQQFLDPVQQTSAGRWTLGSGPSIRLVEAMTPAIERLVLAIRSRERAEAFLRERDLLTDVVDDELVVHVDGSAAAAIHLREVPEP